MAGYRDLTGETFGRLAVIKRDTTRKGVYWLCECSCGRKKSIRTSGLTYHGTKSCGCLQKEAAAITGKKNRTHLMSKTAEYKSWQHMKERCGNKKCKDYMNYGARGIKVCDRWINSFETFIKDMGTKPSINHSIDRKNNDGNYTPENCKWSRRIEQNNNTRKNHYLTLNGEMHSLAEWARIIGINYGTLKTRVNRLGWSTPSALLTAPGKKRVLA